MKAFAQAGNASILSLKYMLKFLKAWSCPMRTRSNYTTIEISSMKTCQKTKNFHFHLFPIPLWTWPSVTRNWHELRSVKLNWGIIGQSFKDLHWTVRKSQRYSFCQARKHTNRLPEMHAKFMKTFCERPCLHTRTCKTTQNLYLIG